MMTAHGRTAPDESSQLRGSPRAGAVVCRSSASSVVVVVLWICRRPKKRAFQIGGARQTRVDHAIFSDRCLAPSNNTYFVFVPNFLSIPSAHPRCADRQVAPRVLLSKCLLTRRQHRHGCVVYSCSLTSILSEPPQLPDSSLPPCSPTDTRLILTKPLRASSSDIRSRHSVHSTYDASKEVKSPMECAEQHPSAVFPHLPAPNSQY